MKTLETVVVVERKSLKKFEHSLRMPEDQWPKRNFKWKPEGKNKPKSWKREYKNSNKKQKPERK